jgi:hypothetical protein
MDWTKLSYKESKKLGYTYHKICNGEIGAVLKDGVYECSFKRQDGIPPESSSLKIETKTKGNEIKTTAYLKSTGCGIQELSEEDLNSFSFIIKRNYIRLTSSKAIKGHEGISVICDKETKKPIPGGEVAGPGFMRFFNGFHPEIEIPISYKVEVDTATKKWKLLVAERGSRIFVEISSRNTDYDVKSYGSHEFHFI